MKRKLQVKMNSYVSLLKQTKVYKGYQLTLTTFKIKFILLYRIEVVN